MESNFKDNKKIDKQKRRPEPPKSIDWLNPKHKKGSKFQCFLGSIISFSGYSVVAVIGYYLTQKSIKETIYVFNQQNVPVNVNTKAG